MTSLKYICTECGTEHDIPNGTDLSFAICANCSAMGEWATPEGAESEVVEEIESEEPESTVEGETEPVTDLILIEDNMSLADIWKPENVDAMIDKLEQYKTDFKGNVKTAKGRKAIISFSRKFSSSKVLVDNMGKELVEDWQTKTKAVNTQRRKFKDACDKFRDESRKPVTDFENAEKLVVANQNRTLARLVDLYNAAGDLDVATYEAYVAEVNAIEIDGDIDSDFYERGRREKEQTLTSLGQKLEAKIKYNKDQADLAKLREAEEKRQAEEAKKAQEKERKANEKKIKLQAKKDADAKAAKKIADAKEAEAKAKSDAKEAEAKAEREKKEAAKKAEADKKQAVEKAERKAKEEAERKERDRFAQEKKEREEAEEKAADKEHRSKVDTRAKEALIKICGLTASDAAKVVKAASDGNIPCMPITY